MKKSKMTGVLVLLIFAIFMVSVLLVLLSGADIVQHLTQRNQRTYHYRTTVQYITTRIRQADCEDAVTVDNSGEISTLILMTTIDDRPYQTRIYCYNGYLREIFCEVGTTIDPEFGEEILPMREFRVTCEDSIVRAELSMPDGGLEQLTLMLRSKGDSSS